MASDLDEELLAAAGCTGTGKGSRLLKRKVEEDYQDSDVDSPEEEDEEEEEVDRDDESDAPSRRDNASTRRRRSFEEEDENEEDDDDDSVSSLSFGEDLIGDDKDRERLAKMNEFQRELLFLDRGDQLQEYRNKKLKKSQEKAEKARRSTAITPPYMSRRASMATPASGRSRILPGRREKAEILSNLVALKQSKTRDSAQKKRRNMFEAGIHTPPSDGDEEDDGTQSRSLSQALDDDEEVESGKSSPEAEELAAKEVVEEQVPKDQISFGDITDITIRRSKLAKWLSEPYFERIVVGCFVRLAVGMDSDTGYRLCQVAAIEAGDPSRSYKLENRTTHKYMSCAFGERVFTASMTRVSEQPPKEEEFNAWKKVVVEDLSVYKELVAEKAEAINGVGKFVYSADTVKRMLEEKKKNSGRPSNLAAEKDRVMRELALADPCDMVKIVQLQAQLKQLEAMGAERRVTDAKAIALAEMNRRNREENFRNASQKRVLQAGQEAYDPFSRRWTRSQNYYSKAPAPTPTPVVASANSMPAQAGLVAVPVPVAEQAAQKEAAESGKLVNTAPPSEQLVQLHRFELPIDISRLQKFGNGPAGAALAYLNNRQRLEGVFEHPVKVHDSHAHPHTLSINDYKRRMNLID